MDKTIQMLIRENELLTQIINIHQAKLAVLETNYAELVHKCAQLTNELGNLQNPPVVESTVVEPTIVPDAPPEIPAVPTVSKSSCWCGY